ncbi:MAG: hypothetical protein V2B15_00025 [Bacteroidota bacterium]
MKKKYEILFAVILLSSFQWLFSQDTEIKYSIGVSAGHLFLAGSFNGKSYFETDESILLVPKIESSFGMGGVLGVAFGGGALETGYFRYRSDYTTMEAGYTGHCTTHLIRIIGINKYFKAYADRRVSPYMDFEMALSYSVFDKIAYPIGQVQDPGPATYGTLILGMGAGTLVRFSERLALDIKILPEYSMGTDIRVKGQDRYSITKFGNFLMHTTFGLKYFSKPR